MSIQTQAILKRLNDIESATYAIRVLATELEAAEPVVVPTPPSTPPPSGPTPVVLPPTPYTPVVQDDFTTYGDTKALLAKIAVHVGGTATPDKAPLYNDGWSADLVSLDKAVLYRSHPTLKYTQPAGTAGTPSLSISLPKPLTKVWFRVKLRWSPGYTTDGVTPNYGKGYKVLGWGWSGADHRGSLELGNIAQYYLVWGVQGTGKTGSAPDKLAGTVQAEWKDGEWYDYIVYYGQTSSTTVRQRWWMAKDGTTPILRADQSGAMTTGTVPGLNRVMLGMNFNQQRAATQAQALWYGQWAVIDGTQYPNPFGL